MFQYSALNRRREMSPLVCRGKEGDVQRCCDRRADGVTHLEYRHIGVAPVSRTDARGHRRDKTAFRRFTQIAE